MPLSATTPQKARSGKTPAAGYILVVDSDDVIRELINYNLQEEYDLTVCTTADDALDEDIAAHNLIILDINLKGGISGWDFIGMLQRSATTSRVPFIICTASDSEDSIIRGFDSGADDYIVKPFSLREMVARVKSVLRRHRLTARQPVQAAPPRPAEYRCGSIVLYPESQRVEADGTPVPLSRTEFQLLKLFIKTPGQFFSRDEIHRAVWTDGESVSPRAIDVNISRLRKKLGSQGTRIISQPGRGYGIEPD